MEQGSFKDFESVRLKATYEMKIGNHTIQPGETIAMFDKIQIAGFNEINQHITANGGYSNAPRVFWTTAKELRLNFSHGVFSQEQLALIYNSYLYTSQANEVIKVTYREALESDQEGKITLKYTPAHLVFVYKKETGEKLEFTQSGNQLTITEPYCDVIVDYEFDYDGGGSVIEMGRRVFNGYIELEGITRLKDDTTGQVVTGLIRVPRLKLMSDLSIRLGAQASPIVGSFNAVGVPVGSREQAHTVEIYFLNDYLYNDL